MGIVAGIWEHVFDLSLRTLTSMGRRLRPLLLVGLVVAVLFTWRSVMLAANERRQVTDRQVTHQ
jgi:hypothetical protein